MNAEQQERNRALRWVMAALAAWGCLIGFGAFLGLDPQTPKRDIRRAAVVLVAVGAPLAGWALALHLRKRRQERRNKGS